MRVPPSKRTLTKAQLAALGSIAAESSYLEWVVDSIIQRLSRLDKEEYGLFLNRAMLGSKLDTLFELGSLKLRSKKHKDELKKIISSLRESNSERTIAIHGIWVPIFSDVKRELLSLTPTGNAIARARGKQMKSDSLDKLAEKISKSCHDLEKFNSAVWVWPAAIRRSKKKLSKLK